MWRQVKVPKCFEKTLSVITWRIEVWLHYLWLSNYTTRTLILNIGDKNIFICDKCQYLSIDKYCLKMHKKSKHNGIIFDCNQCDMKFVDRRGLQNHMNIKQANVFYDDNASCIVRIRVILQYLWSWCKRKVPPMLG